MQYDFNMSIIRSLEHNFEIPVKIHNSRPTMSEIRNLAQMKQGEFKVMHQSQDSIFAGLIPEKLVSRTSWEVTN